MRVTDKMVYQTANDRTMQARVRLEKSVADVSSGRRIRHPADDPAGAAFVSTAKLVQTRLSAIEQGVDRAAGELTVAESAMREMGNVVVRGRELAMQLGTDIYTADDRRASAAEADSLFRNMLGLLNTEMGGRFVFGGFQDDAAPFDPAGNYLGDAGVRQVEIAPGVLENASLRADVAVKGVGGGVDVLQALQGFAEALRNNDTDGIRAALDNFDRGLNQLNQASIAAGSSLTIFESAAQAADLGQLHTKVQIAGVAEVDLVEASGRLALASQALEASIAASAQSFRLSLLDRL